MRTPTASQYAALTSEAGAIAYHRVRVYKAGAWRDLSKVDEQNFQVGVSWNEEQDSPVTICNVSLRRESADHSLAPLVTSSALNTLSGTYDPLIGEGTEFAVDVAVVPATTDYADVPDSDWMEVFRGSIDEADPEGQTTFTGRDLGGKLLDATIEVDREYGSTAGVPVQTVMQKILDDNGFSSVVLLVLGDPDWAIGPYSQKPGILMDALQSLAAQMGWEVRYRWYEPSQAFRLTLAEPDRTTTTPTWTYTSDDYVRLSRCPTSLTDVRNRILVTYEDKDVLRADGKPTRPTIVREDLASQARFGLRVFGITEDKTNNIDTAPEAIRLAEAALADLKDLSLEVEVTLPYNPFHEMGDLICLKGPTPNFTEDQVLAIVGLGTRFGTERAETTLTLRGKPSVSLRTWRQMDISYRAPPSPTLGPLAPYALAAESIPSGFALSFYPPVGGPKPDMYELHLSPTPGFTPDLSAGSTTFYAESKTDTFNVTDLPPGVTRYARVVPKDRYNNAGTPSEETMVTTRYVEPRLMQPRVSYAALPLNSDFEAANETDGRPDAWDITGEWGSDIYTTSASYTGARALTVAVSSASAASQAVSVRRNTRYYVDAIANPSDAATPPVIVIEWLAVAVNGSLEVVGSDDLTIGVSVTPGVYQRVTGLATAHADARFARVVLRRSPGGTGTVTFDSVVFGGADAVQEAVITPAATSYLNARTPYTADGRAGISYRKDSTGRVDLEGHCTAGSNGTAILQLEYSPPATRDFVIASDVGFAVARVTTSGLLEVVIGATGAVWLSLSGVSFRTY